MDISQLVADLVATPGILFVVGGRDATFEGYATPTPAPESHDHWVEVKGQGWHAHINMDRVAGVQFVEQEDHGTVPTLYYVRFSDLEGETIFRAYFPNPYLDENDRPAAFHPGKLRLFHQLKDRYVNHRDVVFVRRPHQRAERG